MVNAGFRKLRIRVGLLCAFLIAANGIAWLWAFIQFRERPLLLGMAFIAYGLGLRHAIDADHIAAIDNGARKLLQKGDKPIGIGFYFSLGHSTIVVGLSIAIAAAASVLQPRLQDLRHAGELIGTAFSAFFLLALALGNMIILIAIWRGFRRGKSGALDDRELDLMLSRRGGLSRIFRGLFRMVGRSWHMYVLGALFGLGFDTASEVALLGLSASGASNGLPIWSIMVFPALFTAGMTLLDSLDGMVMLGIYGWALTDPVRKLYYNMGITFLSALVALLIGGIELLTLAAGRLALHGSQWMADHFGTIGLLIIGVFLAGWVISALIYRLGHFNEKEVRS